MRFFLTRGGRGGFMARCRIILALLLLQVSSAWSQTQYAGTLGMQPIHLFMQVYGDGVVRAMYVYDRYDTPIIVNGKLKGGVLELQEEAGANRPTARLRFTEFEPAVREARGEWIATGREQRLPISLIREFAIEPGEEANDRTVEIIQASSTAEHYFKTIVVKKKGEFYPRVAGVKVLKKRMDAVLQTFTLDAEYRGADNVLVDDYNFDGIGDFSVFESSYAGPNTSSIYFLRNPKAGLYFRSGFSGISLDFDRDSKRIHEHNQCCGGRYGMNATYKVVNNRMVLVEQECYEMDPESGDMKTGVCK